MFYSLKAYQSRSIKHTLILGEIKIRNYCQALNSWNLSKSEIMTTASHRWIWLKGMYCWRFLVKTFNSYTNKSIKSTLLARSTAVDVFGKNAIIVV